MERPRVLIIEAQPYLAQFLTEELDGFHFVFASPSEASVALPIRPFELVVLATDVAADDLANIDAHCESQREGGSGR
jgi:hypothetical protein